MAWVKKKEESKKKIRDGRRSEDNREKEPKGDQKICSRNIRQKSFFLGEQKYGGSFTTR